MATISNNEVKIPLDITDVRSHELFVCTPPDELFHYTSLSGSDGILSSKSLRLTKIQYLSDKSELSLAIRRFRELSQWTADNAIHNPEKKAFLLEAAHQLDSFQQTNICVASFCEDGDLLSQWRGYGASGSGVALGFFGQELAQINNSGWARLLRCVYQHKEHDKIIYDLIDMLIRAYDVVRATNASPDWNKTKAASDLIGYFNTTFLRVAPVLKNNHFREEKEWRIVTIPRPCTDLNYHAVVSDTRVSQYYELQFNADAHGNYSFLRSIVVGPTADPHLIGDALHTLTIKNKIGIRNIHFSQIPFRN